MTASKANLPLSGIKVVELATVVAAPAVGRLFANFGAEVIKVETPPIGDQERRTGGMYGLPEEDGNNPIFDAFNSGKKKIALNLKTAEGKEALFRLLEDADVLLSNVRPAGLKRMGLDYESLHSRFPRLIYAHLSGFGQKGPDSSKPGYDHSTFWLRTGIMNDWPANGDFPLKPTYGFGDEVTAANLAFGIMAAIFGRQQTGTGTLVTISLYGTGIWTSTMNILNTQKPFSYQLPVDAHTTHPFADWYRCQDGKWVYVLGKYEYGRDKGIIAEIFDIPEFVTDPRAETMDTLRASNAIGEFSQKVAEKMALKSSDEWCKIFDSYDLAYGKECHFKDVAEDEQAWANGYLEYVDYPCGRVAMPKVPVKLEGYDEVDFDISGPIGEHTDDVLKKAGYSEAEIQAMRKNGSIL